MAKAVGTNNTRESASSFMVLILCWGPTLSHSGYAFVKILIQAESEQRVAGRSPANRCIAGRHEQHSIHHHRTGSVHRTTVGRDPVDGLEILLGVVFPDDASAFCVVSAHDSV